MYDLGSTIHLTAKPVDAAGNPADVDTMTLTITQPDGTTATLTPDNPDTGLYTADLIPTQAGRHVITWAGTGGDAGDYTYTDVAVVQPDDPGYLISLDDARDSVGPIDDDQLRLYIAAATPVIEDIVGPVARRTVTETVPGRADSAGRTQLVLAQTPVISVQSIAAQRAGLYEPDLSTLVIDPVTGVVLLASWMPFYGPLTVTYTAGRAVISPNIHLAVKEQVRFMWQVGQQGNRPGFGDAPDETEWTPSGFAVPRRVVGLCAPHRKPPGIA